MQRHCIGVFDSGMGGLSVLDACLRAAPGHRYLYYGDNLHAPYGERAEGEVRALVRQGVRSLMAAGAEVIVLACNTATALCAQELRRALCVPVIGTEPDVRSAARVCRQALVLATPHTANSPHLRRLILRAPSCRFDVLPLARLAGEIERYVRGGAAPDLSVLPRGEYDGVVLGCTHYALIAPMLRDYFRVPLFDGAPKTAGRLARLLPRLPVRGEGRFFDDFFKKTNTVLGTDDHLCPMSISNICLLYHTEINTNSEIIFLNSTGFINKCAYKQMFLSSF